MEPGIPPVVNCSTLSFDDCIRYEPEICTREYHQYGGCVACVPGRDYRGCDSFNNSYGFLIPITMFLIGISICWSSAIGNPNADLILMCCPGAPDLFVGVGCMYVLVCGLYAWMVYELYTSFPHCCCCSPEVFPALLWALEMAFWPTTYILLFPIPCLVYASGCRCHKWRIIRPRRVDTENEVPIYGLTHHMEGAAEIPGLVYKCMVCTTLVVLQDAIELDSPQVGELRQGDAIRVTAATEVVHDGLRIVRVCCIAVGDVTAGWTSLRSPEGSLLLAPNGALVPNAMPPKLPEPHSIMECVHLATLRSAVELDSQIVGELQRGEKIKVLQATTITHAAQRIVRVRCDQGWLSIRSRQGNQLLATCTGIPVDETLANEGRPPVPPRPVATTTESGHVTENPLGAPLVYGVPRSEGLAGYEVGGELEKTGGSYDV